MPSRSELVLRARMAGIDPANYPNDSKLEQRVIFEEKNAVAIAGTTGTGTLTSDATIPTAGDTVTIGDITYTFRGNIAAVKATGTLTSDATAPSDDDTVTIGSTVYTFKTALTDPAVPYEVLIGASAAASLDNLKSAINATAGAGTTYGTGTVAHPSVAATTNTDTTQVVEALTAGTAGNAIATTEASTHLSWGAATLAGGLNEITTAYNVFLGASAATALDNLKSAINGTAGSGTAYGSATTAHPTVTATTNTDTTQVIEEAEFGTGADIATTEASTHLSWGAATVAGGTATVTAKDATAAAQLSGGARV